ncbi:GCN5 family acetyltransferase [Rhizobium sp. AC27/96]|nr:GCN5 family acetyltransferase [Rhizobium sp. AC27/96]
MSGNRDPILRAARREDMANLRAVLHDTFNSTWRPNITETAAQAFLEEEKPAAYVDMRGLQFWVAEVAGEVVGFVDWEDDFVHALHVHSAHARRGIGRRLMDHAEKQIAAAGFATARLETDTFNHPSQAFYAARGYREVERYPDEDWDSGLTTVLLVKPLF